MISNTYQCPLGVRIRSPSMSMQNDSLGAVTGKRFSFGEGGVVTGHARGNIARCCSIQLQLRVSKKDFGYGGTGCGLPVDLLERDTG